MFSIMGCKRIRARLKKYLGNMSSSILRGLYLRLLCISLSATETLNHSPEWWKPSHIPQSCRMRKKQSAHRGSRASRRYTIICSVVTARYAPSTNPQSSGSAVHVRSIRIAMPFQARHRGQPPMAPRQDRDMHPVARLRIFAANFGPSSRQRDLKAISTAPR
jgi:hypothetical protein